ncbi:DUF6187 family protein [Actinomycetes bacterium KLBMP 9797]
MTAGPEAFDPRFSLPAVDAPPLTEVGVILLGLDAARLLAGLGSAGTAGDPAPVALAVDEARHGVAGRPAFADLVSSGRERWSAARGELAAADPASTPSAAPRRLFASAMDTVAGAGLGELGLAERAYLAACWVRRDEVDAYAADRPATGQEDGNVVSDVTAG